MQKIYGMKNGMIGKLAEIFLLIHEYKQGLGLKTCSFKAEGLYIPPHAKIPTFYEGEVKYVYTPSSLS
jgi:hypothetical protein